MPRLPKIMKDQRRALGLTGAKLEALIQEAIVDAYGESEQAVGFQAVIQQNLELPFKTSVLGVSIQVEKVDLEGDTEIVAICRHGREEQSIPILDLPLPEPLPKGAEWIEAYRRFQGGAYGPDGCSPHKAGPKRVVPGRKWMRHTEDIEDRETRRG